MINEEIKEIHEEVKENEEPAPLLGKWWKLYTFVFLQLVALIIIFYLFTRFFE